MVNTVFEKVKQKVKKGKKRKTNVLHKNIKLPSVTLSSKLDISSKHINTLNRTKKLS